MMPLPPRKQTRANIDPDLWEYERSRWTRVVDRGPSSGLWFNRVETRGASKRYSTWKNETLLYRKCIENVNIFVRVGSLTYFQGSILGVKMQMQKLLVYTENVGRWYLLNCLSNLSQRWNDTGMKWERDGALFPSRFRKLLWRLFVDYSGDANARIMDSWLFGFRFFFLLLSFLRWI